jgi:hypothetical protein
MALFLLIFGLIRGNPEGWGSAVIVACLGGAVVLFAIFLAIERRTRYPMLDLTLFRKPAFNGISAVAFSLSAGMFALFLYITIYLQGVLNFEPLEAGIRFLPSTLLSFFVAASAGALLNRVPLRVLVGAGLGLVGVGLLLMNGVETTSGWTTLLAGFIVTGIGVGLTNPAIGQGAIAVVPPAKSGMGSGINSTFRQVGISTGVAGLGAIFQSRVDSKLSEQLPNAPKGLGEIVASSGSKGVELLPLPPRMHDKAVEAAKVAFVSGFNEILLIGAIVSFAGALLGFFLTRSRDLVPAGAPESGDAPADAVAASE